MNTIIKSAHDVVEEKFKQSIAVQSIQEKLITNLKENPIYNKSSFKEKLPENYNKKIYKPKNKPYNT